MHSIRTKITVMTVCIVIVTMIVATVFGVVAIRDIGEESSRQILTLLCEAGQKNLNTYFGGVEQSVEMVSAYVESDLDGVSDQKLQAHLDRVSDIFKRLTYNNNGVLTYYYRIDPKVSEDVTGFWYVNRDGKGFKEHQVTDITKYDTDDTSQLVWFTVPKATGRASWLPPYITDTLNERVLSYNTPVYYKGKFVGVIGIELDYKTVAEQVNNIQLYENGYAFINDEKGTIVYHPLIDVKDLEKNHPKVPKGLMGRKKLVRYTHDGVEKMALWLPLMNGMRLNVSVPVAEINARWQRWIFQILAIFAVLLVVFIVLVMRFSRRITTPLQDLTRVAEQVNDGDYDVTLDYKGDDEVGVLTKAFDRLISHLRTYISDLNDLAYADALTHVHNKGAFNIYARDLQAEMDAGGEEDAGLTGGPDGEPGAGEAEPDGTPGEAAGPSGTPGTSGLAGTPGAGAAADAARTAGPDGMPGTPGASPAHSPEFAVCMFDCNYLKAVNDRFGHEKGDDYLKNASSVICKVFSHSPVFRIGGDEFVTVLKNSDYENREELIRQFEERCTGTGGAEDVSWEQIDVAWGMAVYDPATDESVEDVVRRADKLMYENKRQRKGL